MILGEEFGSFGPSATDFLRTLTVDQFYAIGLPFGISRATAEGQAQAEKTVTLYMYNHSQAGKETLQSKAEMILREWMNIYGSPGVSFKDPRRIFLRILALVSTS